MYTILVRFLVVSGLLFNAAGNPRVGDVSAQQHYCRYLAGITMLNNDSHDNDTVKSCKYKQLCALTGVTAASAKSFVNQYKNKPEAWQKIQNQIADILDKKK